MGNTAPKPDAADFANSTLCPVAKKCGGCQWINRDYEDQLKAKETRVRKLMEPYCKPEPIIGMKHPMHYRNKVHAVFGEDRRHNIISGIYEENTHRIVPVDGCLLEDETADEIILSVRKLLKSFKIRPYNEDTGYGLFRHVLVRTGHVQKNKVSGDKIDKATESVDMTNKATVKNATVNRVAVNNAMADGRQIMVVLVLASPVMPSKNNFVKALLKLHPEISTIVLNINDRRTSMILGDKEQILYGRGYIEDELCGKIFRISPKSFYQVNPEQTPILYKKAMEFAALTGKERVVDAYCGTGTIGMIASDHAAEVIGVELNLDAVKDAVVNAKCNRVSNISFYRNDAGRFLMEMAQQKAKVDVVLMDPPRSGSTVEFLTSVAKIAPDRIVYISCNPDTLVRDLKFITKRGYEVKRCVAVDMFPFTEHVETVVLMSKVK